MTDPRTDDAIDAGTSAGTDDRLREAVAAVAGDDAAVLEVVLARGPELAGASAARVAFEAEVAALIAADVAHYAAKVADRALLAYDPSYQTDSAHALLESLAAVPALAELHGRVLEGDLPFDSDGDDPPIVAIAHVLRAAAGQLVAYRLKGAGIATKRQRRLVLVPHDGVYGRAGHVLYHEPAFDALVVDDQVLVTATSTFAGRLEAPGKAEEMARQTFTGLVTHLRIDWVDELAEAVVHEPSMRAKVAQIARLLAADPHYAHHLTMPKLLAFIDAHPHLDIELVGEGEARSLRFDRSPQQRHKIVKLLADDYLTSRLTDRDYEAGSKSRIT